MTNSGVILRAALDWTLRYPLGSSQWIALVLWSILLAGGMIEFGDRIAGATNVDSESCDQGAYIRVAEQNRGALWPTFTDGIRNPLFPWLLAKVGGPDPGAMFASGLRLNIRFGALLVLIFAWWAGRRLALLPAITFTTIGVPVILPISTYVGTEVLFYGLSFATWMLALRLFEQLTLLRCALFGATLALAYLAKPGVTLLTGCFVLVGCTIWTRAWRKGEPGSWTGIRPLIGAAVAAAIFTIMILPRAMSAWEQFRDPLQNTAYRCFWADDWAACYPVLGHLNPRFIGRIPLDQRPSAGRYFEKHGVSGAWGRFAAGVAVQKDNVFSVDQKNIWFDRKPSAERPVRRIFPYRGFFLLPPLAVAIGFWIAAWKRGQAATMDFATRAKVAFALLVTGVSFCAVSWYSPIAPGARFIIALYLPLLASLILASEYLRRQLSSCLSDCVAAGTWLVMFGAIAIHLVLIAAHPYFDRLKGAF